MKINFSIFIIALACSACTAGKPNPTLSNIPAFDAKAAKYIHKQGEAVIKGEAFIISKAGKPIFAAGEMIRLVPATPYARARFNQLYQGKTFISAGNIPHVIPDPEYARYTRTTMSSARGKFEFNNVASGEYYITAQKVIRPPGKFVAIGGAMYTHIKIAGNETKPIKVVVTGR